MPLMPASPIKGPQKSLAFTDPTGRSLAFLRTYSGQKSLQSVPERLNLNARRAGNA
jgi:hypothetical protein